MPGTTPPVVDVPNDGPVDLPETPDPAKTTDWQPIAGAGIAVAGGLYVVWLLWHSYYFVDDFLRLTEASRTSLDWSYLSRSVFGHFVPGWRLTFFLLQRGDPLGYTPVIVITAVVQVVALLGLLRLLNGLFGRLWRNLLFVIWLAVTPALLTTQFWFANALHVLPSMALTVWSLDGFVRYLATRRYAYLAYSVLSLALGLMFYEKPVIVLVLMPALVLVVSTQVGPVRAGVRTGLRRIVSLWPEWILYSVFPIAYFSYYFTHGYYASGSRPPLAGLAHATWLAWLKGIGPTLLGGPFHWQSAGIGGLSSSQPSVTITYVALGLLVAAVIGSVVVNQRAWRGWAFVVVGFVLSFAVAAWGRLDSIGLTMALDFRYTADTVPLVLVGMALAYTPVRTVLVTRMREPGADPLTPVERSRHRRIHSGWARVAVPLAVVLVVAYLGASSVSIWRLRTKWNAAVSRTYWSNVEVGIARLQRSGKPFSLYNVVVPDTVRLLGDYPGDLLSASAGIKYPDLTYDDLARPLYMPDPTTGVVEPATFNTYVGAGSQTTTPFLVPSNGTLDAGNLCLPPGLSTLTLPLTRTVPLGVYDLMVRYQSTSATSITTFAIPIGSTVSAPLSVGADLPAGSRALIVHLAPSSMANVTIGVKSATGVCFQSLRIGVPAVG